MGRAGGGGQLGFKVQVVRVEGSGVTDLHRVGGEIRVARAYLVSRS